MLKFDEKYRELMFEKTGKKIFQREHDRFKITDIDTRKLSDLFDKLKLEPGYDYDFVSSNALDISHEAQTSEVMNLIKKLKITHF